MKTNVTFCDFCDAFRNHDRNESFTYEGKKALFAFIEELDTDCGVESELDVIALDCEFVEYESLEEFHKEYDKDDYETMEDIQNATMVIDVEGGGFIVSAF